MALKALPIIPPALYLRTRFDSIGKIGRINAPLLMLHGTADTTVPMALGRQLFAAANEPKRFVEIPGAHHNDMFVMRGEEYSQGIGAFLEGLSKETAGEDSTLGASEAERT